MARVAIEELPRGSPPKKSKNSEISEIEMAKHASNCSNNEAPANDARVRSTSGTTFGSSELQQNPKPIPAEANLELSKKNWEYLKTAEFRSGNCRNPEVQAYVDSLTPANAFGFDFNDSTSTESSYEECEEGRDVDTAMDTSKETVRPNQRVSDEENSVSTSGGGQIEESSVSVSTPEEGRVDAITMNTSVETARRSQRISDGERPVARPESSKNADSLFITNPPKQRPGPPVISPLFPCNREPFPPFPPCPPPFAHSGHSHETRSSRSRPLVVSRLVRPDKMSPVVTTDMLKMTEIMYGRPLLARVHEKTKFGLDMLVRDLRTYIGNGWLEDITINFYLELIKARNNQDGSNLPKVFIFHAEILKMYIQTGSYEGVIDKTADPDEIFDYELLFFPIHSESHWSLICVNMVEKTVCGYDSLGKDLSEYNRAIGRYLQREYMKLRNLELEIAKKENIPQERMKYPSPRPDFFADWRYVRENTLNTPHQENCNDCGVFILQFAEYLSRREPFNFSQTHMPYFRQRMAYETLTSQLLESDASGQ